MCFMSDLPGLFACSDVDMTASDYSSKPRATTLHIRGRTSTVVACVLTSVIIMALQILGSAQTAAEDPDRLYANRTDLASARRAVQLWTEALTRNPKDFEA